MPPRPAPVAPPKPAGATAPAASRPAAPPSRMTLAAVTRGHDIGSDKILVYGVEGVGKSTFGAAAPDPVFLPTEDGHAHLGVAAFPLVERYQDALDAINVLTTEEHSHRTLVIDTLDALVPHLFTYVCQRNGWASIEEPGYGKGYDPASTDELRRFLAALDRLRAAKRMEIIILAHSEIKPFQNPGGADYNRFEPKVHKKLIPLVKEWTYCNLFAAHEETVLAGKKEAPIHGRGKGVYTGARLLFTTRTAAYDAKERHHLPPCLPFSYADYAAARAAGTPAPAEDLYAEGIALLGSVSPETAEKARKHLEEVRADAVALHKAVTRLRAMAKPEEAAG